MVNKLTIKTICLFVFLLIGWPVQAAWYQVELIVFEHLNPNLDGEQWSENPGLPSRNDSIDLITGIADQIDVQSGAMDSHDNQVHPEEDTQGLVPYKALSSDKFRLKKDFRILELSSAYRPLLHVSWQQPGLHRNSVRSVHLESYEKTNEIDTHIPEEFVDSQKAEYIYTAAEIIFDGTVRLRSSHFLHVDVDLAFFPESGFQDIKTPIQGSENITPVLQQADYVRLTESRRIKLNELHYFDHPLFGVIIQVSRLEIN